MSRRRERRQRRMAFGIFAFIAAVLAGGYYAFSAIQPPPYDEATLCVLSDDPPPHTAVVIDKTDEYTEAEAELIAAAIRRQQDRLAVGERFTLFELDARGQFDPRGEFSLCNPGRGDQVNPLFRNPRIIEERYAELFEGPLNTALEDLVVPKEAPASPILEALARLTQTEAFSPNAPERTVLLVSDMLQNSDVFSAYGGRGALPPGLPDARDTADAITDRFGEGLRGVELDIRLIPRERFVDLQRGPLRAYWDEIFDELGVAARWRDL